MEKKRFLLLTALLLVMTTGWAQSKSSITGTVVKKDGRVPEDLVKRLPGATVDEDGTIKLNGKEVKKSLVDGKECFINDKSKQEGSVPEELVKRLPGATIDDDGTIKLNGKEVKKILVDGKESFINDKKE